MMLTMFYANGSFILTKSFFDDFCSVFFLCAGFLIALIIVLVHTVLKQSTIQATSKSLRLLPQNVTLCPFLELMSSVGVRRCLSG